MTCCCCCFLISSILKLFRNATVAMQVYQDRQSQLLEWEAEKFVRGVEMTEAADGYTIQVSLSPSRGSSAPFQLLGDTASISEYSMN